MGHLGLLVGGVDIGNITPIVQEHEGMSCLVGDSHRQVLGRW